jgi:hypothetical protein
MLGCARSGICQIFSISLWLRDDLLKDITFFNRHRPMLDTALVIRALIAASYGDLISGLYREGPANIDAGYCWVLEQSVATVGDILKKHRRKISSDPRDRIYSLVSLMTPDKQRRIPIDYTLET